MPAGARVEEAVFPSNAKLHSAAGKTPFEMLYGEPCNSWMKMRLALVGGKQESEGSDDGEEEVQSSSGSEKNGRV